MKQKNIFLLNITSDIALCYVNNLQIPKDIHCVMVIFNVTQ